MKETEIDSWKDLLEPSAELAGKITMMDEDCGEETRTGRGVPPNLVR